MVPDIPEAANQGFSSCIRCDEGGAQIGGSIVVTAVLSLELSERFREEIVTLPKQEHPDSKVPDCYQKGCWIKSSIGNQHLATPPG